MNPAEYAAMFRIEADHWWYRGLRDLVFRWVARIKPTDVLDAGCGTGMVMDEMKRRGFKVRGIDCSPIAIEFCQKRGLKDVSIGRIEQLSDPNQSYDLVTALDVIGPLTDEEVGQALDQFYRVLRPGGVVICNTAALRWLYSTHDQACNWRRRYHKKELQHLFELHGFKVEYLTFRLFLLFPIVALAKLLEKKKMLPDNHHVTGDLEKNSLFLNKMLYPVMRLENWLLGITSLPWGSSLFAVARKAKSPVSSE